MQNKKGISLIVLVITIIVMIILAAAIILSLNNAGIIGNANKAVEMTDEAQVNQIAQLGWSDAYVEYREDVDKLREGVENALIANNLKPQDYFIYVTTKGVTIKLLEKAWVKDGLTVVRGDKVVKIGDTIDYNAGVDDYTGEWKVLGADEEGNLLIMSVGNVKSGHVLGYESTMTTNEEKMRECQKDWLNVVEELDGICTPYGKGKGALGARSIKVEDVDAVVGFDPMTASNGSPYGSGSIWGYGNVVTYKYNKTNTPTYEYGSKSDFMTTAHTNGFYYYDGLKFQHVTVEELTKEENDGKLLVRLENTWYDYNGVGLINSETNPGAIEMLFGKYNESSSRYVAHYWLASTYVGTYDNNARFGFRAIYNGGLGGYYTFYSVGGTNSTSRGVRAVVTLSSELELTGDSTNGWSY